MLDRIWAPWRAQYIRESAQADGNSSCFFCHGLNGVDDRGNLLVWRRPHSVVVLNRFPYNNGHLLVAPRSIEGRSTTCQVPISSNRSRRSAG